MEKTIWDLQEGELFRTRDGVLCQVVAKTEDGKGLRAKYLDGACKDEEDFVFEDEMILEDIK